MINIGDKWADENGVEWTITAIAEQNGATITESIGNPPPPEFINTPVPALEGRVDALEDAIIVIIQEGIIIYQFILNCWIMRKIDETKVQSYVTKGYITQAEADIILAAPQV